MRTRTCTLTASTIAVAMSYGLAMAGELPKEGTYKGSYSGIGTIKINQVDPDRALLTFDENGFNLTDGIFDHTTWHCFGGGEIIKGQEEDRGRCIATDLAGDKFLTKFTSEKHTPDQKDYIVKVVCDGGTGKYVGLTCTETDTIRANDFPAAPEGMYVEYITFQGTYKLP